jgi:hypothetical protein
MILKLTNKLGNMKSKLVGILLFTMAVAVTISQSELIDDRARAVQEYVSEKIVKEDWNAVIDSVEAAPNTNAFNQLSFRAILEITQELGGYLPMPANDRTKMMKVYNAFKSTIVPNLSLREVEYLKCFIGDVRVEYWTLVYR